MKTSGKQYKSIPVFSNPILEKYSHVHPAAPFLVWSPVIIYLSFQNLRSGQISILLSFTLVGFGMVTWTLVEYLLHRFFFHMKHRGPSTKKTQYIIHGFHHEDANDPTRLVMTPIVSIVVALIFYGIFRTLLSPLYAQTFFVGFLVGYLCYDYIHYYVHFFNPKNPVGKFLKNHHMKHHFVGAEARWGVSSPLWDYVFGTIESSTGRIAEPPHVGHEAYSSQSGTA